MIAWISLLAASICETLWASSLKFLSIRKLKSSYHESGLFSKEFLISLVPLLTYAFFGIANVSFLTYSLKLLPLAICYAVWMGLALLIQTLIDIFVFNEVITRRQIGFMILVLIGIVGLQVSFKK